LSNYAELKVEAAFEGIARRKQKIVQNNFKPHARVGFVATSDARLYRKTARNCYGQQGFFIQLMGFHPKGINYQPKGIDCSRPIKVVAFIRKNKESQYLGMGRGWRIAFPYGCKKTF